MEVNLYQVTIIPDELAGNIFLGLHLDWVDMVAVLREKQLKFYLDYVGGLSYPRYY